MSRRKSSRREFLKGKSALQAVDQAMGDSSATDQPWSPPKPVGAKVGMAATAASETGVGLLLEVSRRAMACDFQILLNARQYSQATEAAMRALDVVESLEDQMTIYRSHSEISRINQTAARGPVRVDPRLFALLWRAYQLSEATGGAFDITTGPLVKAWGFYRREGRFPELAEVEAALAPVGYRHLRLDPERQTIEFDQPGMEINLGAIGKGYALDRSAASLQSEGIDDFILHGGKSSILARGEQADDKSRGRGWSVALGHPLKPATTLAVLWLRDRAIGTSGDANQFFYHQGRRFGHVIDPRTGFPSQGVLSATVVSRNAAEADALATALFVMEKDEAIEYCRGREDLGLVLLAPGRRSGETELTVVGLDPADVQCEQRAMHVNLSGQSTTEAVRR